MTVMQRHWDIFCRVIDNFGDIGICWRLARQLSAEHELSVRLWVDDPESLKSLCPDLSAARPGDRIAGVEICRWSQNPAINRVADVVVEAFGCELPPAYVGMMGQRVPKPCWINLEYLTAETWAERCHGMASPHPSLPLVKYFFFPGFSPASGGLLRERSLLLSRNAETARTPSFSQLEISLFCYEIAPVGPLLESLALVPEPACCYVPPGKPLAAVRSHLAGDGPWCRGNLTVQPIAFLPQDDYDRLLWRCDINFVRGEDSFLRAQWAGKPFVWQPYVQEHGAHLVKLEAFLERYTHEMDEDTGAAVAGMFRAWTTGISVAEAWATFLARRRELADHATRWAEKLAGAPDLACRLVNFCASKV